MNFRDLDFFQPERERLLLKRKKMIPLVILAVFLILILLVIVYLQTSQLMLTKKLEETNSQLSYQQTEIDQKNAYIEQANKRIDSYENGDGINSPDDIIIKEINAEHLQAITTSTPKEAFYSNFKFEENILTLEGYAVSTQVVAKIVYNLESTGLYENVIITSITNDENKNYKFIISAEIKE